MSNRSYLVCYDHTDIYADDDHVDDFLAEAVYRVPVLWLCLFRPADLQTREIQEGEATETAPIAPTDACLSHLPNAIERLRTVVTLRGDWEPYRTCLADALKKARGRNVTIYLNEIAALGGERFYTDLLRALLYLDGKDVPGGNDAISSMGEFYLDRDQLNPSRFFNGSDVDREDQQNFASIIGEWDSI